VTAKLKVMEEWKRSWKGMEFEELKKRANLSKLTVMIHLLHPTQNLVFSGCFIEDGI